MSTLAAELVARVRSPPPTLTSSHRLISSPNPKFTPKISLLIPSKSMNPSLIVLLRRRFSLCVATPSSGPLTVKGFDSKYLEWHKITPKFAGAANVPFLLLQVPPIVLNAQNLLAGNKATLFAVPWFTGSAWASCLRGWDNLLCMHCFRSISKEFCLAATLGFALWLGFFLYL